MLCDLGGILGQALSFFLEADAAPTTVAWNLMRTLLPTCTTHSHVLTLTHGGREGRAPLSHPQLVQRPWAEVGRSVCGHGGQAGGPGGSVHEERAPLGRVLERAGGLLSFASGPRGPGRKTEALPYFSAIRMPGP